MIRLPTPAMDDRAYRGWLIAVWAAGILFLVVLAFGNIRSGAMNDPDDYLRIQEVRDWLGGQSWFDVAQHRVNWPAGASMHWSRLVDVPLGLMIVAGRPLLGAARAEWLALVIVPLLTFSCAVALVAGIARRLGDRRLAVLAIALLPFTFGILLQFRPMRIDHHAWQIVLSLGVVAGLLAARRARGAALAGLSAAALLDVSIEGLPFVAAAIALLGLRWALESRNGDAGTRLVLFLSVLTAVSAVAFVTIHGLGDLRQWCDAVSPVHLAVLATATAGIVAAVRIDPARPAFRIAWLAGAALAGLAVAVLLAPECVGNPFGQLDPLVYRVWYLSIAEGRPIWEQDAILKACMLGYPLVGLTGAILGWRRSEGAARARWTDHAVLLAAATVIGVLVQRASCLSNILALPGGALLMLGLVGRGQALPGAAGRVLVTALGVVLTLPIAMPWAAAAITSATEAPPAAPVPAKPAIDCDGPAGIAPLATLPPANFVVPFDMASQLLALTGHRMLATGHHRNIQGMRDTILFFMGTPDQALAIARRRGLDHVTFCRDSVEIGIYARRAPDGLAARLVAGKTPGWLRPVAMPAGSPRVWRIVG